MIEGVNSILSFRWVHSESGMTLVELMVSTGLFGIIAVTTATLYSQNATLQARAQNEIRLESGAQEFINALEVSLGAATRMISCGCGASGTTPPCAFSGAPAADCVAGGCLAGDAIAAGPAGIQLIAFEAEDSNEPSITDPAASVIPGCSGVVSAAGGPPFSAMKMRGCKRIFEVRLIAPVPSAPGTPATSQPGSIQINRCKPDFDPAAPTDCSANPASPQTMGSIPGVYSVWCGHPSNVDAAGANVGRDVASFRFDIRAKAKFEALSETWSPDPAQDNAATFGNGIHRTFSITTVLKNTSIRGVHFGKFSSDLCARDGQDPTNFAGTCCSGYRSFSTGMCVPTGSCIRSGGPPSTQDVNAFIECCSHQLTQQNGGGAYVCL
ncbi:MAG: type II secretion system protein [Bdellovibrionales bacterium]|nr:type II secretion system protein [Bdellovibrionales bacterium]